MCTITATEFKTNLGKYLDLCQKEKIIITKRGKPFATLSSSNDTIAENLAKLFGTLPNEAYFDNDIDRE